MPNMNILPSQAAQIMDHRLQPVYTQCDQQTMICEAWSFIRYLTELRWTPWPPTSLGKQSRGRHDYAPHAAFHRSNRYEPALLYTRNNPKNVSKIYSQVVQISNTVNPPNCQTTIRRLPVCEGGRLYHAT